MTAAVTSPVRAEPPRSGGSTPAAVVASMAASTRAAQVSRPRWRSSRAPLPIAPNGSAIPFPAMSGALPCTGSNMLGALRSGFRFALAAMPRLPASALPRSDRMSACRLDATTTDSDAGRSTNRAAIASTRHMSFPTSG